jgi:hypothetical protein
MRMGWHYNPILSAGDIFRCSAGLMIEGIGAA